MAVENQKQSHPPVKGRSPKGLAFAVPPTRDMFYALRTPSCWGPSEFVSLFFSALIVLSALFVRRIPYAFYVIQFLFWRLSYNGLIGLLLRAQSNSRSITAWLESRDPPTHALLRWGVTKSLPQDKYDWAAVPACFNAWLAFRALATVILANDGISYAVLALASHTGPPPTALGKLRFVLLTAPLAALLTVFGVWAKSAAHAVLSDFAWFWGDFFFTIDANLSFDGVFNLVPHPMYTAGYGPYYAAALVTGSHSLFQISLLAHLAQMLFLALVEHPHIRKTYPPADPVSPSAASTSAASPGAQRRAALVQEFADAAPDSMFRATLTVAVGALTVLLACARAPVVLLVLATVCVHARHWLVLVRGLSPASASAPGPRLLASADTRSALVSLRNSVLVSNAARHALFAVCAWRLMPRLFAATQAGRSAALLGWVMIAFCAQGWRTALADVDDVTAANAEYILFEKAGDGDCASRAEGATTRFLSRPLLVLPYATYYAAALAARSPVAAAVAVIVHTMHVAFARHMSRLCAGQKACTPAPTILELTLRRLPGMAVACRGVTKATDKCIDLLAQLAAQIRVRFERGQADAAKQGEQAVRAMESKLAEIGQRAVSSAPDGQSCVNELQRRGVKVAAVDVMRAE